MRLVEAPAVEEVSAEINLATVGRWALGADAVLLVDLSHERGAAVLASDGLDAVETQTVLDAVAQVALTGAAQPAIPEFSDSIYCEQRVPGIGVAAVWALKRSSAGFENVECASIFAAHAAVACAARRLVQQPDGLGGSRTSADPAGWILDSVGYEELNHAIAHEIALATGGALTGVLLWDEERSLLCPVPGAFGSDHESLPAAHAAHDWGSSAARVFATGQPYLTNRATADPGVLQDFAEAFGFIRLMTLPITVGERRVGVLQVANKATDFTLDDLAAAMALGGRIAIGVEVAQIRNRLMRAQRLEEVFSTMAVQIASGRDLHEFLAEAMDNLCAIVRGSLVALVPFEGDPVLRRRRRDTGAHLERTLLSQARGATSLRVYGVGSRRAVEPGWSVVHVPVMLDGDQAATVSVMRRGGNFFDAVECQAFSRLANLIALAWSTERYQRHLADSACVAERQRIADELHDHVAQLLFGARLSLEFASELTDVPDVVADGIRRSHDLLLRADVATRKIMEQNSHPDDEPLSERLAATIGSLEGEFGRPVALDISDEAVAESSLLSRSALKLLCRAVREALINAIKHAGPCQLSVRVTVTRRHRILVTITDSGIGVTDRRGDGYGTAALRRSVRLHGGQLRVAETATGGTKVAVSLPL